MIARYHYNLQIPYHRTRSGFDFALKKFASQHTDFSDIFTIKNNKLVNIDFARFSILDDGTIFESNLLKRRRNVTPAPLLIAMP